RPLRFGSRLRKLADMRQHALLQGEARLLQRQRRLRAGRSLQPADPHVPVSLFLSFFRFPLAHAKALKEEKTHYFLLMGCILRNGSSWLPLPWLRGLFEPAGLVRSTRSIVTSTEWSASGVTLCSASR